MERELIQCPRQPGRLRISKQACALRYLKAQEARRRKTFGDRLAASSRWGLELCRNCPEGRHNAKKMSTSRKRPD
jgi:hypothetical protein